MPSLPTRNVAPESQFDAYRRYLPPGYRYSFELYIPNSFSSILVSYIVFIIYCILWVLVILAGNWIFVGIKRSNYNKLGPHAYIYLHDIYWYLILSLYCYCFTLICYRKIPREHIHTQFIINCYTNHWKLFLYFVSFLVSSLFYIIHMTLYNIEWNKDNGRNKSLSAIFGSWNIYCNVFICDDWKLTKIFPYCIVPATASFINCLIIHYFLFGFRKNIRYYNNTNNNKIRNNHFYNQFILKTKQKSNKSNKSKSKSNKFNFSKSTKINKKVYKKHKKFKKYKIKSFDSNDLLSQKSHKSHSHSQSQSQSHRSNDDLYVINQLNESNPSSFLNQNPFPQRLSLTGDSDDDDIINDKNHSLSSTKGITISQTFGAASIMSSSDYTVSSFNSSPLNLNESFIKFKYPEVLMLRWIFVYYIIIMIVYTQFMVLSTVQNQWYHKYFGEFFIAILISVGIFKWILKRVSRLIDSSRYTHPTPSKSIKSKKNKHNNYNNSPLSNIYVDQLRGNRTEIITYLSLELVSELYMDFIFFLTYRQLFMYYIPNWNEFFILNAYFLCNEIWICSIRPSKIYYKISLFIQHLTCVQILINCLLCNNRYNRYNINDNASSSTGSQSRESFDLNNYNNKLSNNSISILKRRTLFFNWNDDSTLIQWQIRNSLDIVMRILANMISATVIIVEVFVLGPNHFNLTQNKWQRGIQYIAITAIIQFSYFVLLYFWNVRFMMFSILEPWWSIQKDNKKMLVFVCITMISIAFWLPDL